MELQSAKHPPAILLPWVMIRSAWRNRELLWQFTIRNVELRHRGSMLGIIWAVLNPLLMLALYVFVFGFVFGGSFGAVENETKWEYGLGVFLGLAMFHLVAEAISMAPGIIVGTPNFVKKVVFPLEILPAAAVGSSVIHMLITLAMVLLGALLGERGLTWLVLWLPIIVIPVVALAAGLTWLIAALGVFFRDIAQIVGAITTGLLFASAIFYPVSSIPPAAWSILRFNPLIHAVDLARDVVLWEKPPSLVSLTFLLVTGLGTAVFGYGVFARLKPAFADVV